MRFLFNHQIFGAIAIPLDDRKNVFVSYNFEANYNSPFMATDFYPGFYNRVRVQDDIQSQLLVNREIALFSRSVLVGYKKF